ncbi:MAG: hypothetical protein ACI9WU_003533 [Myxococcota bacterium]
MRRFSARFSVSRHANQHWMPGRTYWRISFTGRRFLSVRRLTSCEFSTGRPVISNAIPRPLQRLRNSRTRGLFTSATRRDRSSRQGMASPREEWRTDSRSRACSSRPSEPMQVIRRLGSTSSPLGSSETGSRKGQSRRSGCAWARVSVSSGAAGGGQSRQPDSLRRWTRSLAVSADAAYSEWTSRTPEVRGRRNIRTRWPGASPSPSRSGVAMVPRASFMSPLARRPAGVLRVFFGVRRAGRRALLTRSRSDSPMAAFSSAAAVSFPVALGAVFGPSAAAAASFSEQPFRRTAEQITRPNVAKDMRIQNENRVCETIP